MVDRTIYYVRFDDTMIEFEKAKRGALRWAVGSQHGQRSSTWRIWGNRKGDIYISTRSMGNILKASFHRDRNCHVGFTSQYAETARKRMLSSQSRHWDRWTIPDDPVVRAMQIVVPASELRVYPSKEETQTKWLPPPPSGWFSVVSIFITKRGVENKWPGYENGAKPIGVIITQGRIVWAVCAQNPIDEQTRSLIEGYRVRLASLPGAAEAPREPNIRAILWGFQEEHERFFVELAWSDASQSS